MKALVCQKNEFTSSRTGETYHQVFLAMKDKNGTVRISMSPKSNYKEIQPYFLDKAVFDVLSVGKIYDFSMQLEDGSMVARLPKTPDKVKEVSTF